MGWSFACDTRHDKKACVAKLTGPGMYSPGYTALRHRVVGNHLWTLLKLPDGRITIHLCLLAGGGHQGMGWGYKSMDEESGPYVYDCPPSFLDEASEPRGYAIKWREMVRQHHTKRKTLKPYAGMHIKYGEHEYLLMESAGPRRGWRCHRVSDGQAFRLKANQISRSELV
jgi:hypothetical protein